MTESLRGYIHTKPKKFGRHIERRWIQKILIWDRA